MTIKHLTDDELDLVLIGEELSAEAAEHLSSCVACRRRRDGFLAAVGETLDDDPDEATRARVRDAALAAWGGSRRNHHWVRWVAAAAAAVVLALLPLVKSELAPRPRINTDAVLTEVDDVLSRDPLAAAAPEEVVEAVAPAPETGGEGSWS
ncbi:MAG TPA: hypothetical protein VMT19_11005 [Thermoanaerobaculaceae bacterium]|nr:hypothetical protein [Thermoanaerobaculaceae bacterium]